MSPVVGLPMNLKRFEFLHQAAHVPVGDEFRFLGEPIKRDAESLKRGEHAVQHGLVSGFKGLEDGFITVLAGVDELTDRLLNGCFVVAFLTQNLGCLVESDALVVLLCCPPRVWRLPLCEQPFHAFAVQMLQGPRQNSHLLAHVVDVVLCSHVVAPQTVQPHQGVAQNGVASTTHVKGAVRIGRGVFDQHRARFIGCELRIAT